MDDQTTEDALDESIADDTGSDVEMIAKKQHGNSILPYIEQDN
ncbi:MAG: hypothetical protein U0893_26290 [Chloroflexota bacterium]